MKTRAIGTLQEQLEALRDELDRDGWDRQRGLSLLRQVQETAAAVAARDESGGLIHAVTDRQILNAYRLLARSIGVFVELGSAASVAGLLQSAEAGLIDRGQTIVCTVTGHGLKDPDWAISTSAKPTSVPADVLAAAQALNLA